MPDVDIELPQGDFPFTDEEKAQIDQLKIQVYDPNRKNNRHYQQALQKFCRARMNQSGRKAADLFKEKPNKLTEFLNNRETKFERKVKEAVNGCDDFLRSGRDSFLTSFGVESNHPSVLSLNSRDITLEQLLTTPNITPFKK